MLPQEVLPKNNSKALKTAWAILIITTVTIGLDVFFIHKNYLHSESQQKFLALVEAQKDEMSQLNVQILLTIQDTSYISSVFKRDLLARYVNLEKRNRSFLTAKFTEGLNAKLMNEIGVFSSQLQRVNESFFGISKLVLDKNKGAFENKDLIIEKLEFETSAYMDVLYQMQKWSIHQTNAYNHFLYRVLTLTTILFLTLAILGYILIIIPFKSNHRAIKKLMKYWENEVQERKEVATLAISKKMECELDLKTKTAQIQKLKDSLAVSISKLSKSAKEKDLIYYNFASDLSEYLRIILLQVRILENDHDLISNSHWTSLTNTVSDLDQLAKTYYAQSKEGHQSSNNSVVYLSQLLSELLLTTSNETNVQFLQLTDMPTIKTNEAQLKRVLQPYLTLMSAISDMTDVINISAKEDGSVCEIKFIGLPPEFATKMNLLNNEPVSELSLDAFKTHMSNKIIEERGGKQWLQFDSQQKGVFIIHWAL